MRLSELIKFLESKRRGGDDPEILFESYEWTDDLEEVEYLPRYFDGIRRKDGKIIIRTSR